MITRGGFADYSNQKSTMPHGCYFRTEAPQNGNFIR